MKTAAAVQPLLNRACRPMDWAAAKIILCAAIPKDKTRGNTSTVRMKHRPDGRSGVGTGRGFISYCMTDALDGLLLAFFLYV